MRVCACACGPIPLTSPGVAQVFKADFPMGVTLVTNGAEVIDPVDITPVPAHGQCRRQPGTFSCDRGGVSTPGGGGHRQGQMDQFNRKVTVANEASTSEYL